MPLKLVLRPGEKMIINGAVIGVGDHPVSLFFYNKVNFLRGREIMKEENCDTVEKKLYFIIQLIYIFPEGAADHLRNFDLIYDEARAAHPDKVDLFDELHALVLAGNNYRALKLCRKLFEGEMPNGEPTAARAKRVVEVVRTRRRKHTDGTDTPNDQGTDDGI